MQILRESIALRPLIEGWRSAGERVALVPTMGALHRGHLELIAAARRSADRVIATIFVNPLQFNDPADLERYPRDEGADLDKLRSAKCDAVWLGGAVDLFPDGFATTVSVAGISDRWEGAHRPGHFDGVATIVAKLLIAVMPDVAIFGEKDWQQLAVIKRITADLGLAVQVHGQPTVRDDDGLALSSRNALLTPDARKQALALPIALERARDAIRSGSAVGPTLAEAKQSLLDAGFLKIDYFALIDAQTLEPLNASTGNMRLIAAATVGTTRLIDNLAV